MALQRAIVVVVAALDCGLVGCSSPAAPAQADSNAIASRVAADLGKEITALREQQIHLIDELRGVKAELSRLPTRIRPVDDDSPAAAPPSEAAQPAIAAPAAMSIEPALVDEPSSENAPATVAAPEISQASSYVAVAKRLIEDEDYPTAVRVLNVAAEVDPDFDELYFERGVAKHLLQSFADAIDDFQAAITRTQRQDLRFICLYNQACGLARLGREEEAIGKLVQSDEAGFRDLLEQMTTDPDLDSLRDLPRFKEFVMMLRTR